MASEFEFSGRTYLIGKLNAEDQFHVFRRVMPLIGPIMASLKQAEAGVSISAIALIMMTSDEMSRMPDDQLNYVIHKCMGVVEVRTDGAPIKLMVAGRSMFGDMDLPTMIQIVWAVLMENFRPFLSGLLAGPSNGEEITQGTS